MAAAPVPAPALGSGACRRGTGWVSAVGAVGGGPGNACTWRRTRTGRSSGICWHALPYHCVQHSRSSSGLCIPVNCKTHKKENKHINVKVKK